MASAKTPFLSNGLFTATGGSDFNPFTRSLFFFFLAVLGLGCREGFSLVVANGGFSLVAV